MLILIRKIEEDIAIQHPDGVIWIRVLGVERDRVKLGITAPQTVLVQRREVFEDRKKESIDGVGR